MHMPLALLVLLSAAVGVLTGRWLAIVLSVGVVAMFYVGLKSGWWGDGAGDGWQYAMVIAMAIGAAITAVAVGVARAVRR